SPTAIAHLEYDIAALPPPPSGAWTRFVCTSDTHCRTFPVPPGDVLLHSGDLTNTGTLADFRGTLEWIRAQPHALKIIIAGNHDLPLHEEWYAENYGRWHSEPEAKIIELLKGPGKRASDEPNVSDSGLVYLQDQSYVFQTREGGRRWSIYGSPWQPEFCNWAFNYERDKTGEDIVKRIPKTDILLTHGPPFDILDATLRGQPVGCEALRAHVPKLRPRLHLFGHIHEARGAEMYTW
ncbi:Metallo-dependent phosphatase, partial [Athelia psychrophila]